jgi:hypothetical protein
VGKTSPPFSEDCGAVDATGEVPMRFAQIRSLVPTPRQPDQPKGYVGRHRAAEPVERPAPAPARNHEPEPETVEV